MEKRFEKITKCKLISLILLLLVGTFLLSMTMVRSGIERDYGIGFWGPNGHDGVWHLALQNQVHKNSPPLNPVFSGEKLTNYHYFYDLLVAGIGKATGITYSTIYFQILPVLTAFLIGLMSFIVGYRWRKDYWTGFWLTLFNYFAGSLGWIVTLLRSGQIGGESMFWSMQSISTLINPPFAFSLVFILSGMLVLLTRKKSLIHFILLGLIFGIIINIKAYGGLIGLVSLFGYAVYSYFHNEKKILFGWLLAVFITLITFVVKNGQSVNLFEFNPFWFVNSLIESSGRLYLPKIASARYNLAAAGFGPKLFLIESFSLFVFILGNMGTRIVGFVDIAGRTLKKRLEAIDWFLIVGMIAGFSVPLFFTQKGTAWNSIQFFYYFLFFANFYTASIISSIQKGKNKKFSAFVILLIVLATVPTTYSTVFDYFGKNPAAYIPKYEIEGLKSLAQQPDGVVLSFPYDQYKKRDLKAPLPLRFYETTAYVSAYSNKVSYLEDEMNNGITGFDWAEKKDQAEKFFSSNDPIIARGFLLNNDIDYIYLAGDQFLPMEPPDCGVKVIFNNGQVRIYKVLD